MIKRTLEELIGSRLFSGKTILLLGPRQVGKTTLMKEIHSKHAGKALWFKPIRQLLKNTSTCWKKPSLFSGYLHSLGTCRTIVQLNIIRYFSSTIHVPIPTRYK